MRRAPADWILARTGAFATTGAATARFSPIHAVVWAPYVALAYIAASSPPAPRFGDDTRAYMLHLDGEIDQLSADVITDAKGGEGAVDACIRATEVRGDVVDAVSVLQCAGVKSPTKAEINAFGACFVKHAPTGFALRSVLAKCGAEVAKASGAPGLKPHATDEWRRAFSHWIQDWRRYLNEHQVDLPGYRPTKAELDTWHTQLHGENGWRDRFEKLGGKTLRPVMPKPAPTGIPWGWIVVAGVLYAAATLLGSLAALRPRST